MNNKLINIALNAALIIAIAVITLGTLAIPVIMALTSGSWYWMFLYLGYLVSGILAGVFASSDGR